MTWALCILLFLSPILVPHEPVHGAPAVAQPAPKVERVAPDRPGPSTSHRDGTASWYCGHGSACHKDHAGGLYAAAGPALRVGKWRGRLVEVWALGRSVTVRLVDWCACPKRVIDLYSDAFGRLAPLSQGVLKVSVTW